MDNCKLEDRTAVLQRLADALMQRGLLAATAESCTGGGVAHACTSVAGSSQWFVGGVVSYSNAAKVQLLGVPTGLIDRHGAVSEPVAVAMAEGVLSKTEAAVSVAITGVAGPTGGSDEKPVGTVWFAWARRGESSLSRCVHFDGDRAAIREQAVGYALQGMYGYIESV